MTNQSDAFAMRLDYRAARVGQVTWLATSAVVLVCLVPTLMANGDQIRRLCVEPNCNSWQLTHDSAEALRATGISPAGYAIYHDVLIVLSVLVFTAVAGAIVSRRPSDPMALLTGFALLLFGGVTWPDSNTLLQATGSPWKVPVLALTIVGWSLFGVFVFLFPAGRFIPRWTAFLAAAWVVFGLLTYLLPNFEFASTWENSLLFIGFMASMLGTQIYRYRNVADAIQRRQTQWVTLGIATGVGGILVLIAAFLLVAHVRHNGGIPFLLVQLGYTLAMLPVPLAIGFAVLRYRLWDIDVVINRTLVYFTLTLTLGLGYLGSVIGLQAIFRAVSGQNADLAVAISTLIIAGLFNPLRDRIQTIIARTFYRQRYNAAQILALFVETARDETDLQKIESGLLRVVDEAVHPRHMSLWLREGSEPA